MRLGGVMISLILPKLIRSVARDDICTFNDSLATAPDRLFFRNDRRQVRPVQAQTCRNSNRPRRLCLDSVFLSKNLFSQLKVARSWRAAPATLRNTRYFTSTLPPASSSFFLAASE